MDCEDVVYSNDYFDFIAEKFSGTAGNIYEYCTQKINNVYTIVYAAREGLLPLRRVGYCVCKIIPLCH